VCFVATYLQLPLYVAVPVWPCAVLSANAQSCCSFTHFYMNHFTASRQYSHNTHRTRSSAGTEPLCTAERGCTVPATRRAARQLHGRASAQSVCERRECELTFERCVQDCYCQMLLVCVTDMQSQ
jgi:hypothetical protein